MYCRGTDTPEMPITGSQKYEIGLFEIVFGLVMINYEYFASIEAKKNEKLHIEIN